jgi:hypothetical protein
MFEQFPTYKDILFRFVFHSQTRFRQQTRSTMDCTVACPNALLCPSQHISNWRECGLGGGGRMREVGRAFRGIALDELVDMDVVGFASQQVIFDCQDKRSTYQAQIGASNWLMLASPRRATSPQHCVEV